jgi:hypothetical protein
MQYELEASSACEVGSSAQIAGHLAVVSISRTGLLRPRYARTAQRPGERRELAFMPVIQGRKQSRFGSGVYFRRILKARSQRHSTRCQNGHALIAEPPTEAKSKPMKLLRQTRGGSLESGSSDSERRA